MICFLILVQRRLRRWRRRRSWAILDDLSGTQLQQAVQDVQSALNSTLVLCLSRDCDPRLMLCSESIRCVLMSRQCESNRMDNGIPRVFRPSSTCQSRSRAVICLSRCCSKPTSWQACSCPRAVCCPRSSDSATAPAPACPCSWQRQEAGVPASGRR